MRFAVQRSIGSRLGRDRLLKKIDKHWKRGTLNVDGGGHEWRKSLCVARLMLGDFSRWDGWEFRSGYSANVWINNPLPIPKWDSTPTEKLLILAEEGVGDEVMFMSLLPEAIVRCGYNLTVECDKRFQSILERSFKVKTVGRLVNMTNIREWLKDNPHSAYILMGDLARFFRRDKSHFPGKPYLKPSPERVNELERFRGMVGTSWAGNHGRYDPEAFIKGPWLNLQYNETHPKALETGLDVKNDLEGVLALCSVLSRVVTVSTSVAHIACAVGTETHVIHAPRGSGGKNDMDILNWKWGTGGRTYWYGSARVYENLKQYEMLRPRDGHQGG